MIGLRITIVLDKDLEKELRKRQARSIWKTQKSVSFSNVINTSLRKQLRIKKAQ